MTTTQSGPPPAATTRRKTPWIIEFYRSDVGKKWVMAVTGIVLLGYIVAHMLGNLKIYIGPDEINEYGEALRDLGGHLVPRTHLLWILRIGLTAAFALHIHAAYVLTIRNRKARGPQRYEADRNYLVANYASRTMRWSGVIILLFLIFHLADLTWGVEPAAVADWERGEVYANLVGSFQRVPVALVYIVANIALGFHIFHGSWSLFQSLGVNNHRFNHWRKYLAGGFTALIMIGNLSFPIAVLIGIVG